MTPYSRLAGLTAALCLLPLAGRSQSPVPVAPAAPVQVTVAPATAAAARPAPADSSQLRSTYVLGPDDLITIQVLDAEEISGKPIRIDLNGNIRIAQVGRLQAAGLTVEELEARIAERLKETLKKPDVTVAVLEFHSQPVSVLGSVRNPGVQQLQGQKTLVQVLAQAGGLTDDAGPTVKITRRLEWGKIPLPTAVNDPSGQFSVAEASLKQIMNADNPTEDIVIRPQDVISVPHAPPPQMVYVLGTVPRAGGFILGERANLSVLHALTLAGGTDKGASPKKARILRPNPGGNFTEIPVDLNKLMAGRIPDVPLQPEDILFVPASGSKKVLGRVADVAAMTASALIYRIP